MAKNKKKNKRKSIAAQTVKNTTNVPGVIWEEYDSSAEAEKAREEAAARKKKRRQDRKLEQQLGTELFDRIQAEEVLRGRAEERGRKLGDEFFSEGALGRLDATRTADDAAAIARREEQYESSKKEDPRVTEALKRMEAGLGGISAAENQALRESMVREIRGQTQTDMRDLRAFAGASGMGNKGIATGQMMALMQREAMARASAESDLVAKNVQERARRLTEYTQAAQKQQITNATLQQSALDRLNADVFRVEQAETGKEQFNIGQQNKETAGRLGSIFGTISSDIASRNSAEANINARKAAENAGSAAAPMYTFENPYEDMADIIATLFPDDEDDEKEDSSVVV